MKNVRASAHLSTGVITISVIAKMQACSHTSRQMPACQDMQHADDWTDADIVEALARLSIRGASRLSRGAQENRTDTAKERNTRWSIGKSRPSYRRDRKQSCYVFLKQTIFTWSASKGGRARERRREKWQLTDTTKGKRCESTSYLESIWCLNECAMNKYDTFKWTSGKWFSPLSFSFPLKRTGRQADSHRNSSVSSHGS